ncbi:hypothetical protein B0H14DRAFT_2643278 [Mycena olivaceomarginata]|nr:hypothetical protein B0H14DRAFT_2643278 [Mycena olivaceomarginata]
MSPLSESYMSASMYAYHLAATGNCTPVQHYASATTSSAQSPAISPAHPSYSASRSPSSVASAGVRAADARHAPLGRTARRPCAAAAAATTTATRLLAFHIIAFNAALLSWCIGFFKTDLEDDPAAVGRRLTWATYQGWLENPQIIALIDRATQAGSTETREERLLAFAQTLDFRYIPHETDPVYVLMAQCKLDCHPAYTCTFTHWQRLTWAREGAGAPPPAPAVPMIVSVVGGKRDISLIGRGTLDPLPSSIAAVAVFFISWRGAFPPVLFLAVCLNLPKPTNVFGTPRNWSADARKKGFTFTGAVFKSHFPSLWSAGWGHPLASGCWLVVPQVVP